MLWVVITDGPLILNNEVNNIFTIKFPKDWSNEETKEASHDLKAGNILISLLSAKVYFSTSHHKTTQSIWNAT